MEIGCTMLDTWREVRDATIAILERTTFADLASKARGPWILHLEPPAKKRTAAKASPVSRA
jgi:DNA-binding IscR family transcriptional regulator